MRLLSTMTVARMGALEPPALPFPPSSLLHGA